MKEKIKSFLSKIQLIPSTFAILTIYFMCSGFSLAATLAFGFIAALLAFENWVALKRQPKLDIAIFQELKMLKDAVSLLKLDKGIGTRKPDEEQPKRYF